MLISLKTYLMKKSKKRVLFYSSVQDKHLFTTQRFYHIDINILHEFGCEVLLSNNILDALCFWKYDFVFAYFYRKSFFTALIAALFLRPTYFTGGIDDLDINYASPKRYRIQKIFFRLCYWISKSCIIVSDSDLRNIEKILNKTEKLSFSEHTIDVEKFVAHEDILPKEKLFTTIVWMGNKDNVKRKGVDTALKVFSLLQKNKLYADYRFLIIGKKGEGTSYVESLIEEYGLQRVVMLTDEISEETKINILLRSKYYFQLSIYEGFGLAALEALATNNIVIHSGKGGLANPIFSSGIIFNIGNDLETEMESLLKKMSIYNNEQLEEVSRFIIKQYDNSRRREDFFRIIDELK